MGFALPVVYITAAEAAAASVAVAVAGAALTYKAQQDSVKSAQRAMDANALAASLSASGQYRGLIVRQIQEEDAAAQEIDRVEREGLKAESAAALAGVEAGAGGGVLADQVRNFRAASLSYSTAVRRNLDYRRSDTALTLQAVGQEAKNRISTYRPSFERPSLAGAGLTIAGGFLDASRFTAPNRTTTGGSY